MVKKNINIRIGKLFKKIRIRINEKMGLETELDLEQIRIMFPHYHKAISKIAKIKENVAKEKEYMPKSVKIGTIERPGIVMIRCGGGYLVRKGHRALWT